MATLQGLREVVSAPGPTLRQQLREIEAQALEAQALEAGSPKRMTGDPATDTGFRSRRLSESSTVSYKSDEFGGREI